ncbi:MAG: hypothetical protein QN203_04585 [Armatimonadota bacterium]|nr:hypothetical protein [Armatimonadota bacterium]
MRRRLPSPGERGSGHRRSLRAYRAALLVLALVGGACGPRSGSPERSPAATVEVVAREWAFAPPSVVVRAGRIAVRVRNEGLVEHNLVVDAIPGAAIDGVPPGETRTAIFELPPGAHTAYCNIPGHREAGMAMTIRVDR